MSDTNEYLITNLTEQTFRFLVGRKKITILPDERRTVNIKKNPEYKMLIEELPNTHKGLIEATPIKQEEVNKQ